MKWIARALVLLAAVGLSWPVSARQVVTPASFTLDGSYDLQTYGGDTTYMRSLTHRYVSGQLRFLSLTHTGLLQEFVLPGGFGQTQTATTNSWNIGSLTGDFTGITWDEANTRLWVTATVDYGSSGTYYPTRISTVTLNTNGTISNAKTVSLQGITSKRLYGNVLSLSAGQQTAMGCTGKPYLVGNGGYTSLMAQTSRAALGPSLICIPDISGYSDGAEIPSSAFKVILDTDLNTRGYRATFPLNYFDGQPDWLTYPPTAPPDPRSGWLSPNPAGYGWMVWGDSYYNNATIVGDTLVMVAALCKGKCWYQDSTLNFDDRTQEIHTWPLASLTGANIVTRPAGMAEVVLPRGAMNPCTWSGNVPECNVSGITYDVTGNKLWMVGYPLGGAPGGQWNTGRLYRFSVGAVVPPQPPGDTTPPVVTVTSPANGSTITTSPMTVSGSAMDAVGVVSGTVAVNAGTPTSILYPYSNLVALTSGNNGPYSVVLTARDAAGNVGSASVSVTIAIPIPNPNPPPDTTPPVVTISSPANEATITASPIHLIASATDNVGVLSGTLSLNGAPATAITYPYTVDVPVTSVNNGPFTLALTARDVAGNVGSSSVRVTVNVPIPPSNPCVTNPGVLTVSQWPISAEGSRQLRYSYTVAGVITTVSSALVTFTPSTRLTVTDIRGCSAIRNR